MCNINNLMDLPPYSPGLHKLVTLHVDEISKLTNSKGFVAVTDSILEKYEVEKAGSVMNEFDNEGFTFLCSLKKGHICVYTKPEYKLLHLDVYFLDTKRVQNIIGDYIAYFKAEIIKDFEISK